MKLREFFDVLSSGADLEICDDDDGHIYTIPAFGEDPTMKEVDERYRIVNSLGYKDVTDVAPVSDHKIEVQIKAYYD